MSNGWLVGCNIILHSYGDFNITGEGQQNYTFARRLWHTCCDTGPRFFGLIRRTAPFSRYLRQVRGNEDLL